MKTRHVLHGELPKNAIKLTYVHVITVPKKEAFACKECNLILIIYEDEKINILIKILLTI